MFWGDKIVEEILVKRRKEIASGKKLVIRDEKTASGRIHVGSMRGVAVHGLISELLTERGVEHTYLYEINDFDAFDTVPTGLDKSRFKEHLGKPLFRVPSPDESAQNYAEYFGNEFIGVIEETGYHPTFIYSSKEYQSGKYNDAIRTALEKADIIRDIYKRISGSIKENEWLPLMVVCEKCGNVATTRTISFDGTQVHYICDQQASEARGCKHEGDISPYDGNAKLPWKVEWAAKFKIFNVTIEGNGKDLSTRGGARDVADHIAREVFEYEPPFNIPYEFFLIEGKKMSASKGTGSSSREIADFMPAQIFRLALVGKDPKQAFNFDPKGDTIPILFDTYDRLAEKYFAKIGDDDARLFGLIHKPEKRKYLVEHFLPRFSQIAFLVQMPHINIEEEVERMKGASLVEEDRKEFEERAYYASKWLTEYAPEAFKYELQEEIPVVAKKFTDEQKAVLRKVFEYIETQETLDGQEFHTKLHEIRKSENIEPKEFFSALYMSFLGKESGPKVGWFLSVLDKEFLKKRLREVSS